MTPCIVLGRAVASVGTLSQQGLGHMQAAGDITGGKPDCPKPPRTLFASSCLKAPAGCCSPISQRALCALLRGGRKLQGPLSGGPWVCLCKAACQESISPTGDVAAGCRFPLKSPGQDSGEALNIRCLSPPGGCDRWKASSQLPAAERVAKVALLFFRTRSCRNGKRTFL